MPTYIKPGFWLTTDKPFGKGWLNLDTLITSDPVEGALVYPVENTYVDNAEMFANQPEQTINFFQYVVSTDTYYEYLGTTNGNLTDYREVTADEVTIITDRSRRPVHRNYADLATMYAAANQRRQRQSFIYRVNSDNSYYEYLGTRNGDATDYIQIGGGGSTGFEAIDEGSGLGWVKVGRTAANYGPVGLQALDASFSNGASSTRGSVGDYTFTFGLNNPNRHIHSFMGGFDNYDVGSGAGTNFESTVFTYGAYLNLSDNIILNATFGERSDIGRVAGSSESYQVRCVFNSFHSGGGNRFYGGWGSNMMGVALLSGAGACTTIGVGNKDLTQGGGAGNGNNARRFGDQSTDNNSPRFVVGAGAAVSYTSSSAGGAQDTGVSNRNNAFVVWGDGVVTAPMMSTAEIDAPNVPELASGTTDGVNTNELIDSTASFQDNLNITAGDVVRNTTDTTSTTVASVTSDTVIVLNDDIFTSGEDYVIEPQGFEDRVLITREYLYNTYTGATGLEALDEGNGTGWRLVGKDPANYGNIGLGAVDFSFSNSASSVNGARGQYNFLGPGGPSDIEGDTNTGFGAGHEINAGTYNSGNVVLGSGNTIEPWAFATVLNGRLSTAGTAGSTGGSNPVVWHSFSSGYANDMYGGRGTALIGSGLLGGSPFTTIVGSANVDLTAVTANQFWAQANEVTNPAFIVGIGTINSSSETSPTFTRANGWVTWRDGTSEQPSATVAEIDTRGVKAVPTVEWVNAQGFGDVTKVGTPLNDQIVVWTGDGTADGNSNFIYNGTTVTVTGSATAGVIVGDGLFDTTKLQHDGLIWDDNGNTTTFTFEAATGNETVTVPHATGTVALTSDITKELYIEVFDGSQAVTTGDGSNAVTIPSAMNGWELSNVVVSVEDKGVTGTTDVQVRRWRAGVAADMLSTAVTVGDEWFAQDGIIDAANDDVATGDRIYIDVDAVHSGTAPNGLAVVLEFTRP